MRGELIHRGPDGGGVATDTGIGLAHTRLKVIGLSRRGSQPMWARDGRWALLYNGEVYNYQALRERLQGVGHLFHSRTDTEVVLNAWSEWGTDALNLFEGMFAFVVWDREERRLWLARDRFGIKPLYWHHDGEGTFVFASEIRALLASGLVQRRLDRWALSTFLSQQTVPSPATLIDEIQMLPAAGLAEVRLQDGQASPPVIRRYWNLLDVTVERRVELAGERREKLLEGLRERLRKSVERRLVADVPLGAFLSGGVDSTTVVALMAEVADVPVRTFTVAFEEEGWDDGPYARRAADRIGTDHHEVVLSDEELVEAVPDAVRAQDHPSGDGINTWIVSRAAREAGLTVALSGLGGDELFGGYPTFDRIRRLHRLSPILRLCPKGLRRALGKTTAFLGDGRWGDKVMDLLATDGSVPQTYPVLRQLFGERRIGALTGRSDIRATEALAERLRDDFGPHSELPLLARVSHAELTSYTRDVLLRDTDQMGMSHSLEVRVPLLDRELVEYALSLPEEARARTDPPKRWLVEAVEDVLPESVARRSKSGFGLPFDRWMRGPLRSYCREGMRAAAGHPALRAQAVADVWTDFEQGKLHWSRPWLLVALGRWVDRHGVS